MAHGKQQKYFLFNPIPKEKQLTLTNAPIKNLMLKNK